MTKKEYKNIDQAIADLFEKYDCVADEVRFEKHPGLSEYVPVAFDEWGYNKSEDDDLRIRWDSLMKVQDVLQQLTNTGPIVVITIEDDDPVSSEEMTVEEQFNEQRSKLTQYNTIIFAGTAVDTGEAIPFFIETRNTI